MRKLLYVFFAVVFISAMATQQAQAARVIGVLSNFDVHNFTDDPCNDFELILVDTTGNPLRCGDIGGYFPGWGTSGGQPNGGCHQVNDSTIMIRWVDDVLVDPCTYVHLGIWFKPGRGLAVRALEAWWTLDGARIMGLNFLWQMWDGTVDCPVGDIVWPDPDFNPGGPGGTPPWTIDRQWAWLQDTQIPLNGLTQDSIGFYVTPGEWNSVGLELVDQFQPVAFYTPPLDEKGSVVVTYPVMNAAGDTLVVFYNAAWLGRPIPSMTEWGLIILVTLLILSAIWIFIRRRRKAVSGA